MHPFTFNRASSTDQAVKWGAAPNVRFIAGGTTLTDLMKLGVEHPTQVVDINRLPLAEVERTPEGGLKVGALVRNSDLAWHLAVKQGYPVLSEALLAGASGQLRNMATTGGNLLQRTRCMYFRDNLSPCNKREPGTGCAAIGGANRTLAIFGTSEHCIATNPSDMNVALVALGAQVHIQGNHGSRVVPVGEFFLLPGSTPQVETVLQPGELITHVALPPPLEGAKSGYLKLRDRASYEFALASAAVVLQIDGGRVRQARVALGGVGTLPWRSPAAEQALVGAPASAATWRAAAEAAVRGAKAQSENGFKIELAKRCVAQQLATVAARV
ncbi:FAD binding domain-containing protein [Pseudomonas typographi]|uniref:Xanthine dehydrogenase family protein subunit M n=1 Tax=Pseudomonas typographi TaxID=2715964 RepID=A0ABR7Z6E4_9PSED|nr:xanthine dehydrogenase family protein subunit M [Pseudomonas typographi]MBD1554309.1 xanthine dehydrogenase family protein subunit M [Pseudomonas typographi]MBD1589538.1 xanthine dehydrogenase family protein subunit M [Pseudomonas typographi]MBD1600918.1 xanthine dehydrogenase family protein subunit M [Pseudomonas typographi]